MAPVFVRLDQNRGEPHFFGWDEISRQVLEEYCGGGIEAKRAQKRVIGGLVRLRNETAIFNRELAIKDVAKSHIVGDALGMPARSVRINEFLSMKRLNVVGDVWGFW